MSRRALLLLSLRLVALLGFTMAAADLSRGFARKADVPVVAEEVAGEIETLAAIDGLPQVVTLVVVAPPRPVAVVSVPLAQSLIVEARRLPSRAPPALG